MEILVVTGCTRIDTQAVSARSIYMNHNDWCILIDKFDTLRKYLYNQLLYMTTHHLCFFSHVFTFVSILIFLLHFLNGANLYTHKICYWPTMTIKCVWQWCYGHIFCCWHFRRNKIYTYIYINDFSINR